MEFDKTKVYTIFNWDELKIGSKGYFANCKDDLIYRVTIEDKDCCRTLEGIVNDSDYPFKNGLDTYHYFYLVEEPKKRPYENTEELINDFCNRFKVKRTGYGEPFIWVKPKARDKKCLITAYGENYVYIGGNETTFILKDLMQYYTYLDGSCIGKE